MALKPLLNRETLKREIGDANILDFYFGAVEIGRNYLSVFRDEQRPSCSFYISKNGSLTYHDFTTGDKYDFVQFVAKLFSISYYKALERIAIDFGLIPGVRSTEKPAIIKEHSERKVKEKKEFTIELIPFAKHHLDFWAKYYITKEELIANKIQAVGDFKIGDYEVPYDVRFFYPFADSENKYYKIYTPFSYDYKWVSSTPLHLPFGINELPLTHDTLVITKSVKDTLVLRKFFPEVIGLQNEGRGSLLPQTAKALKKCYKNIYVWFDMDRTGVKAANYYSKTYGFKPVFVGSDKLTIWQNLTRAKQKSVKDPSDMVKQYGLVIFAQYLKHLKLT